MKNNKINLLLFSLLFAPALYAQQDTAGSEFVSHISDDMESEKGNAGSFGKRLSSMANFVSINGYVTNDFLKSEDKKITFDQHYFNLLVSTELSKKLLAEAQLEYENAGSTVTARYAQVDYKFSDLLIIRSGKFLIPAGEYNEYLYPEYISKMISRPYVNMHIIPVTWEEVGVQIRGQYAKTDSSMLKPYYAFYIVNGLEGKEGSDIRDLRDNAVDTTDNNKALGGEIGFLIGSYFNFTTHFYKGRYTPYGKHDLRIFGSSVSYDDGRFSMYAAFHNAQQELYLDSAQTIEKYLNKYGFYVQLAYNFKKTIEPVVRYGELYLDGLPEGNKQRLSVGLNYHFHENAVFKANYDFITNHGTDVRDNVFSLELAIGF